jgi:hypothetical protein
LGTALLDSESIFNVRYATHRLGNIFSPSLVHATVHCARQSDFSVLYRHFNLRSIHVTFAQAIVNVFFDTFIRAAVTFWTTPTILIALRVHATPAFRFFITEPRGYCVRSAIPPAAVFSA